MKTYILELICRCWDSFKYSRPLATELVKQLEVVHQEMQKKKRKWTNVLHHGGRGKPVTDF